MEITISYASRIIQARSPSPLDDPWAYLSNQLELETVLPARKGIVEGVPWL